MASLTPVRPTIELRVGGRVSARGRRYSIRQILDLETVLGVDDETGTPTRLRIADLAPELPPETATEPDLVALNDEDWRVAQDRFAAIQPLLQAGRRTRAFVGQRAQSTGVDTATLYRWLRRFESTGKVSSLVRVRPGAERGLTRLSPEVEAVIHATIDDKYLSQQRPSAQYACNEVLRRCRHSNLKAPHPNTVRNRIARLSGQLKLQRRVSVRAARERFDPETGTFPGADWPLAVVQIDHTKIDLVLVDDIHRRPVGRPWITVAIDVFSRMIAGFYVSFDPPGALSVGLCVANAILPKDTWLAGRGLGLPWPVWGIPGVIHVDNAREFRGHMLQRACKNYGITLEWRPVARPNYGAHIERLLGTFNSEIHALPGTTFSNVKERGEYDSAGKAAMTLAEFELWLAQYILGVYHQRLHSTLGVPPLKRYEQGIFGDGERPGCGLPNRITDERRVRLDFMPYFERSVQTYGIVLDEIHYYGDVLRTWINAPDPDDSKRKRQFIVRRDPRDISVIHFLDPESQEYFEIPYRNTSRPALSVWELRAVRKMLADEGKEQVDEDAIFKAYDRMRAIEDAALKETATVRRREQRRRLHGSVTRSLPPAPAAPSPQASQVDLTAIHPFDEMDELD
jgi:putative transposase